MKPYSPPSNESSATNYFAEEDSDRPLELSLVRATDYNEGVDTYRCSASLTFQATDRDVLVRKGVAQSIQIGGEVTLGFRYEVSPDATDPAKFLVAMGRITALELGGLF